MALSTLTSKGQTTIPKAIREYLDLKPGDRIDFVTEGDRVYLKPINRTVKRLSGILHRPDGPTLTLAEIEAGIQDAAVEDVLRGLQ